MKKFSIAILFIFIANNGHSQKALRYYEINNQEAKRKADYRNSKEIVYYHVNGRIMSESNFNKKLTSRNFFQIPGDSLHQRKLVKRENHGKITDYTKFIQLLETELKLKIDPEKPIVVIYYPGPNACNSSGSATKKTQNEWFSQMEAGIKPKTNAVLYLYKTTDGMKGRYDLDKYRKDPQGIMEQLFFPYNFPCSSLVVIGKTGNYISYYGEFGKPLVWKFVDYVGKKY
jgi:hypothetical protein